MNLFCWQLCNNTQQKFLFYFYLRSDKANKHVLSCNWSTKCLLFCILLKAVPLCQIPFPVWSRDSVVGIATGYDLDD
jgi:hypothetical protein